MSSTLSRAHGHLRVTIALLALSAGLVGCSMASSALASTTIGQTFVPDGGYPATTFLQSVSPAGQYSAPSSGVITSWSFEASVAPAPLIKLKVARAAGSNMFTIVGSSPFESPILEQLNTYTGVRIPVQAGDILGLYLDTDNAFVARDVPSGGYAFNSLLGIDPPTFDTRTYDGPQAGTQFDISAILEADCDGDGLGDETQDPDTSSCNPPAPASASVPTGRRAAAKKHCKKKFPKGPRRAKCLKKAKRLPV